MHVGPGGRLHCWPARASRVQAPRKQKKNRRTQRATYAAELAGADLPLDRTRWREAQGMRQAKLPIHTIEDVDEARSDDGPR